MSTEVKNLGFNSTCMVTVKQFKQLADHPSKPQNSDGFRVDKNGKLPVMLVGLAGKNINANVLSGSSAELYGFTVGNTYGVQITEKEPTEYDGVMTRQFDFSIIMHYTSIVNIMKDTKEMGAPSLEIVRPVKEKILEGAGDGKNILKNSNF
jgi:hypothetical protein